MLAGLMLSPVYAQDAIPEAEVVAPETVAPVPAETTTAPKPVFVPPSDVPLNPDQEIIKSLMEKGFFNPMQDNRFYPDNPINRAEFVTLLYRASDLKTPFVSEFPYFRDVPVQHWAYLPIEGFRIRKLVDGDGTGYFHPEEPISRMEAGLLLGQTLPSRWLPLTDTEVSEILHAYPETEKLVTLEAQEDIARSIYAGLLTPVARLSEDKNLLLLVMDLESPLSRMDAVRMIHRRLALSEDSRRPTKEEVVNVPAGVSLPLTPTAAISRDRIAVGESFYFSVTDTVDIAGTQLSLPRGSRVHGLITEITGDRLLATVQLDKIQLPSGEAYKLSAELNLTFDSKDKEGGFLVPGQDLNAETETVR